MRHRGVRTFFSATGDDGTVVVLVALLLSALVASAGVAVDGGVGYVERRMMQSAADAAATAGTLEMQRSWNGESFGTLSQPTTESVATTYATMNRWTRANGTLTFRYVQRDGSTSPVLTRRSRGVVVSATQRFPSIFARTIGIASFTAGAAAAAEFGTAIQAGGQLGAYDAIPVALNDDAFDGFGRPARLQPAGSGSGYGNFNFASIVPPGCAAGDLACYTNAMASGSVRPIGIQVPGRPGSGVYPVNAFDNNALSAASAAALQARIDSASGETCTSFSTGSRRVVIIPVANGDIGGSSVTLVRFRAFFISRVNRPDGFSGCFVRASAGGGAIDPSAGGPGYGGVLTTVLIKVP